MTWLAGTLLTIHAALFFALSHASQASLPSSCRCSGSIEQFSYKGVWQGVEHLLDARQNLGNYSPFEHEGHALRAKKNYGVAS